MYKDENLPIIEANSFWDDGLHFRNRTLHLCTLRSVMKFERKVRIAMVFRPDLI